MNKEQKLKLLDSPKLGKQDTFTFGCNICGECCRGRDGENAIMLTALDIFKIAKHLNITIEEFLQTYCNSYCGEDSKMPIVILKAKAYRGSCPFLKGKCTIHSVKPAVCALFPLGRITDSKSKKLSYIQNHTTCGDKKTTQTVEEWLSSYDMLHEEEFTIMWQQKIMEFAEIVSKLCEKCILFDNFQFLGTKLYMEYDLTQDFLPQFEEKCNIISKILAEFTDIFIHKSKGGKTFKCPSCGKTVKDHPALSRKDNKTEICPNCGTLEALESMKQSDE